MLSAGYSAGRAGTPDLRNTSAVFDLRRASSVHHDGAASLISYLDTDDADVIARAYLRKFMLHTEVSTALRQRKPVNDVAYSYLRSQYIPDVPENPSAALDVKVCAGHVA